MARPPRARAPPAKAKWSGEAAAIVCTCVRANRSALATQGGRGRRPSARRVAAGRSRSSAHRCARSPRCPPADARQRPATRRPPRGGGWGTGAGRWAAARVNRVETLQHLRCIGHAGADGARQVNHHAARRGALRDTAPAQVSPAPDLVQIRARRLTKADKPWLHCACVA